MIVEETGDFWWVDGLRTSSFVGGAQIGKRFEAPDELKMTGRFDDVSESTYIADLYIQENAQDRVEGSVLYPSAGLLFFGIPDGALVTEICRAYNSWIIDFASYDPDRLKAIAMVNLDDIDEGVAELERCRDQGFSGALIPLYPHPDTPYDDQRFDRVWAAAQDLDLPLSLHLGTNRTGLTTPGAFQTMKQSTFVTAEYWICRSIADLIFAGVFERYPRLQVGSVENGLGWAPHFLDRMDYLYTDRPRQDNWRRFQDPSMLPSDFFRRNVFMSFQDDKRGVAERHHLGVEQLLWGSDYPHTESTFPRSAIVLDELFEEAGVDGDERWLISYANTCRLYGFDEAKISLGGPAVTLDS